MPILNQHYLLIRFSVFMLLFVLMAWWEAHFPWRPWLEIRIHRWLRHFSLSLISKLILRMTFPILLISVALDAQQKNMGFLNHDLPRWLDFEVIKVMIVILGLDLFMYIQHRLMHRYRILWRFHRVHHTDRHLDASTGLRFNPLEEIYTMAIKMLAVVFLGASALSVFIYEVWYNFALLFAHLNVALPRRWDIRLRRIFVTPGMHRVHHSDNLAEANSNFGFIFSWWDRLFDSYKTEAMATERKMIMGLDEFKEPICLGFWALLFNPFNLKRFKPKPKKHMVTHMHGF